MEGIGKHSGNTGFWGKKSMLDRKGQEGKRSLQKELGHSEQSVEKDPRDQQVDYSLRIVYSSVPME